MQVPAPTTEQDTHFVVTLRPELHHALKLRSVRDHTSMRSIIRDLLQEHLAPELKELNHEPRSRAQ